MRRPNTQRSVRRTGAILASVASAALVLSACGGSDSTASDLNPDADLTQQSLTVSNWAGYYPEDMPANFETAVGTPMTITNHATTSGLYRHRRPDYHRPARP